MVFYYDTGGTPVLPTFSFRGWGWGFGGGAFAPGPLPQNQSSPPLTPPGRLPGYPGG